MRRLKRILLFTSGVWAFVAVAGLYSVHLAHGTPDWYQGAVLSNARQLAAANQSDQTVAACASYANDIAAAQRRRTLGNQVDPIAPKTITLTSDQINAFIEKWESSPDVSESGLTRYLSDARVGLADGQVLLAGTIRQQGLLSDTVLSMDVGVALDDDGRLRPNLVQMYAGRLPLPRTVLAPLESRLRSGLERDIARWQSQQHFWPDGLANNDAAAAAWSLIFLAALDDKPADPVLLLPCELGPLQRTVPIRLTQCTITDGQVSFTLRPLTAAELQSQAAEFAGQQ
jgi:hypothetical protein